jgi:hypothetical protein
MRSKIAAVVTAVLVTFGLALMGAAPAQAAGVYSVNNLVQPDTSFYALCKDGNLNNVWSTLPHYLTATPYTYDCRAFSVGDNRQVQYRSAYTGYTYWSACGRNLPHPGPDYTWGWQSIGNDVELIAKRNC